MILVVGSPHDRTVIHTMVSARRLGVPYAFFDVVRFLREGDYSWDSQRRSGHLDNGETRLRLPDPRITGIYVRLVDIAERVPSDERDAVNVRMKALSEALRNLDITVVNRPGLDPSNWAKLYHLQLLGQCGFTLPRSLVTNDEEEARAFLDDVPAAIFKGASGEKTIASELTPPLRSRLNLLTGSPVLFQERIFGDDVRAHLVGHDVIAELIESTGVNYQYSPGVKTFRPIKLPDEITEKCLTYQARSRLTFIGFDFMVTPAGDYVVLEANPMPGYESYDRRLGRTISTALFRVLGAPAPT